MRPIKTLASNRRSDVDIAVANCYDRRYGLFKAWVIPRQQYDCAMARINLIRCQPTCALESLAGLGRSNPTYE